MKFDKRFGILLFAFLIGACSKQGPQVQSPPEVTVFVAQASAIANITELPGRVQAIRTAQVRARVNGIVQRRLYTEGSDVRAGQKLFQIDPREATANLHAAEAAMLRAEATQVNAAQDVERYKGLVKDNVISQQAYDTAIAALRTAQADLALAKAQVETARLTLSYTSVTAPISGRARRAEVTEGAFVIASSATLLTIIEQLDPIFVNFSQSSSDLLSLRREVKAGTLKVPEFSKVQVNIVLEDGSLYAHPGHMNFLDLSIDSDTGTAAMRAEFPNPDRRLLPGQFVRAQITDGVRPNGIVVPQRAVKLTPQGASVMIVDKDNIAVSRDIKVGALFEGSWIVLSGLETGDRVIIDGLQKVQPGAAVSVVDPAKQTEKNASVPLEQSQSQSSGTTAGR
jgi:membrane fusion protein (multidrug efflux system)